MNKIIAAPAWETSDWLNSPPLTLDALRGKVVVLHAFQMLCPGCVTQGIPQATAIFEQFDNKDVQVIGLHSVFEHQSVMTKDALIAFVHEWRIRFPIAIDKPAKNGNIPVTMSRYQLKGTPSLVLIDRLGKVRLNHFGHLSDMQVGSAIGQLLAHNSVTQKGGEAVANGVCDDNVCGL
jgi:peroxiredoxin